MDFLRRGRTRAEFERFTAAHADGLLRTGFLITSDLPEAEDLLQDCLLRLARSWPRVRAMEHPAAYARRILVNLAIDGAKRRTRRNGELRQQAELPDGVATDDGPVARVARLDTRAQLIEALRTLPARQRAVLVMRYFEDLSESEVAETLGCSTGTVKSTASRGLARLRQALGAHEPAEQELEIGSGWQTTTTRSENR